MWHGPETRVSCFCAEHLRMFWERIAGC